MGKLLGGAAIATALVYVLLAPGLVVTLPGGSGKECAKLVPGPTNTAADHDCDEESEDAILADICAARKKCRGSWASGYTNVGAVFLHAFLFALLSLVLVQTVAKYIPKVPMVSQ